MDADNPKIVNFVLNLRNKSYHIAETTDIMYKKEKHKEDGMMKIAQCKTNHLKNPLGYMMGQIVFTYQIIQAKGRKQTEARIRVALNEQMTDVVFDSGWTEKISPTAYTPEFILQSKTRYWWMVEARTDASEYAKSNLNWFETPLNEDEWEAKWITVGENECHPVLSRVFRTKGDVRSARLYICGLGLYEAEINGEKIGDEYLTPYCNDYHQWQQYQTYDVTQNIQNGSGDYKLSVMLGDGWYKGRFGLNTQPGQEGSYGTKWKLIAQLILYYQDGRVETIGTDDQWEVSRSCVIRSSIYDGEEVDYTISGETIGRAEITEPPQGRLAARLSPPVQEHETFIPTVLRTPSGEMVLDMGQNFAGIFRMHVNVPRGETVRLYFGEVLQNGNFYRDNLRTARAEYVYHSDGKARIIQPYFTFYGYRYVKVEGISQIRPEDFTGIAIYSAIPKTGSIKTGHESINRLIENCQWGQKSNFIDVPTDCPQRDERMGWTGDAQVFSETACFFRDCYSFYQKYLYDLSQEQNALNGMVPDTVPAVGQTTCSSVWGDAACIIPWNLYKMYGDSAILKTQFESMRKWVDYITEIDREGDGWKKSRHYGDWLALDHPSGDKEACEGGTDEEFIADVYYMYSTELVAQAAEVIGESKWGLHYRGLAEQIRNRIAAEYYSPNGRCVLHTQTAQVLTWKFQLGPNPNRAREGLKQAFLVSGGKLQTGFVGTPFLCGVLCECGLEFLAWQLVLNEAYPGWLYEVKLGATTIWERWNSLDANGRIAENGMNSLNHYAFGSIAGWFFQYAAGLQTTVQAPGFMRAKLAPVPHMDLKFLDMTYESAAGLWKLRWETKSERQLRLEITVPFGCEAELKLPLAPKEIAADGTILLRAGEYAYEYETTATMRHVFSLEDSPREIQSTSAGDQFISQYFGSLPSTARYKPLKKILQDAGMDESVILYFQKQLEELR